MVGFYLLVMVGIIAGTVVMLRQYSGNFNGKWEDIRGGNGAEMPTSVCM